MDEDNDDDNNRFLQAGSWANASGHTTAAAISPFPRLPAPAPPRTSIKRWRRLQPAAEGACCTVVAAAAGEAAARSGVGEGREGG